MSNKFFSRIFRIFRLTIQKQFNSIQNVITREILLDYGINDVIVSWGEKVYSSPYDRSSNTILPTASGFHGKSFLLSYWSGIDRTYSQTDVSWTDTKLPDVRTADKEIRLAIAATQAAFRKLRYLEILSGTLSNYALCISWAFIHPPKNISQILLGVKCISTFSLYIRYTNEKACELDH